MAIAILCFEIRTDLAPTPLAPGYYNTVTSFNLAWFFVSNM